MWSFKFPFKTLIQHLVLNNVIKGIFYFAALHYAAHQGYKIAGIIMINSCFLCRSVYSHDVCQVVTHYCSIIDISDVLYLLWPSLLWLQPLFSILHEVNRALGCNQWSLHSPLCAAVSLLTSFMLPPSCLSDFLLSQPVFICCCHGYSRCKAAVLFADICITNLAVIIRGH